MQLIIIGNGFDLAHGLPTKYWNFREYLEENYQEFLFSFEKKYDMFSDIYDEENTKSMFWNELEANLSNIREDIIIEDAIHIDMGLESCDLAIEDTLYDYFKYESGYINRLGEYLQEWVCTINMQNIPKKTNLINKDDTLYINFNYTELLERSYGIDEDKVIHIHGSANEIENELVLGHDNKNRIVDIGQKIYKAEENVSEKEISICKVLEEYYVNTYKDISINMPKLDLLSKKDFEEIYVVGHSLANVDIPYFKKIDSLTRKTAIWKVYYHICEEEKEMLDSLIRIGIDANRIEMINSKMFFNI